MDCSKRLFSCLIAVVLLLVTGSLKTVLAQTAPPLGTAQKFAVLGSSTVTNTGSTVLTGDLGVSPGSAVTGFPPGTVTGAILVAGAAAQAHADALTAYNFLLTDASEACTANLSTDLGGMTLVPGVYCFSSSAGLTGTLTLNATGNPNGVFVFKMGSTLITASNSKVVINGGSPCNVYFQVGSSATLGTGTKLLGSIFAVASITMNNGASLTGGAYALNGAVTLINNAVTACRGTVKVCKVAGSGVAGGTPFAFSVDGTPLPNSVPAGPSPLGSCSAALEAPAHPVTITETLPANTTLTGVSTLPGTGLLLSSNLSTGTATVAVIPGVQTTATFINTVPPVTPTAGFLQICKIAGSGVTAGTNFNFSVAGTPVTVPAGPAPGGTCSTALEVPAGQTLITETLSGATLTAVSTLPVPGLLVSSNLAAGTATVTVNAGGTTIATFTNAVSPTTGFLKICKVAGIGVAEGTNFAFRVAGTPSTAVTVPAGLSPDGSCSAELEVAAGQRAITETLPAGTVLASVITSPGAGLVTSNLGAGTATVTVNAGVLTTITFTNTTVPVTTGFLQICKVAGAGVTVGTNFTFSVGGTSVTVPAGPAPLGSCSAALVVTAGQRLITETLPSGTALTSVSTLPTANLLVSSNLAAGTATVTVAAGGQTIATFLNTIIPAPNTGFLQICKIAGAGVAVGTDFTFSVAGVAGTPVTVKAGLAPGGTCSPALVAPVGATLITETLPSGTALTSVSTLPSGLLLSSNLAEGTATVTVNAGGQTIVTFLNTIIPALPTGYLKICKVAGSGVPVGTSFTFTVAGNTITVPAGSAPGGSCSQSFQVPAGQAVVTEGAKTGVTLVGVSASPSGRLVTSNLTSRTAAVTIVAGGTSKQSKLTFTNQAEMGLLKVCKIAGTGVASGAKFTFVRAGATFTVPAGFCVSQGLLPIGTVVTITEQFSSTTVPSAIGVLPANRQGSVNLPGRRVTATIGTGVTEVHFTNRAR